MTIANRTTEIIMQELIELQKTIADNERHLQTCPWSVAANNNHNRARRHDLIYEFYDADHRLYRSIFDTCDMDGDELTDDEFVKQMIILKSEADTIMSEMKE